VSTKNKKFSWFLLSGKALTWDVLCSRGREGPGRCYLCKQSCESNFHIAVECPFTQAVWSIIEDHLKLNNLWYGESLSVCFKNWCFISDVVLIKSLPIIVLWFTWRARNRFCFEDLVTTPAQVSSYSLGMIKNLPQSLPVVSIRSIFVEDIDKTYAWGYFDGSAAGDPMICGAGGVLFISDIHYVTFKAGLGLGTNNYAELCALKLHLRLTRKLNLDKIQVFGDSQLVIHLATGKYHLLNTELAMILQDVHCLADILANVSFKHIYRERNFKVDTLAKAGGSIIEGSWSICEQKDATMVETFQVF